MDGYVPNFLGPVNDLEGCLSHWDIVASYLDLPIFSEASIPLCFGLFLKFFNLIDHTLRALSVHASPFEFFLRIARQFLKCFKPQVTPIGCWFLRWKVDLCVFGG